MQCEGEPRFLKFHQGHVRGVAFSPRDRYIFCSGGYDGKVNLYSALRYELLMSYQITSVTVARNINAVKFTSDGSKILTATTARRIAIVDVERGEQLLAYDNCVFSGRDRAGIAVDPVCPNIAVCVTANGKGLTILDLRMPLPLDFIYDLHGCIIRDVMYLPASWPRSYDAANCFLTVGSDGICKISGIDGRSLYSFHSGQLHVNTICPTPETFNPMSTFDNQSRIIRTLIKNFKKTAEWTDENALALFIIIGLVTFGGNNITSYLPESSRVIETINENRQANIWKLKYKSNGSLLYSVSSDGRLRKYRRYPRHHQYLGIVYIHKGDIQDMDISPFDEYIVTASKDKTVGIMHLGAPTHGWTEYCELT